MKRKFTLLIAALALLTMIVQPGKAWGQAAVGTTMWAEDFSGFANNVDPSGDYTANSHTGTTVYGGVTITYSKTNGGGTTQTYTSGGPNSNNNLLIAKGNGTFTISGISTGEATELTVSYAKSGSGVIAISSSTTNVSVGGSESGSTITTNGASTIAITFTNTGSSNLRIDDIAITVKTAGGTPAVTHTLTVSANPTEGGNVTVGSTTLAEGATTSISATANAGYVFDSWTVEGEGSIVNEAGDTFTMGTEDATLTANFTQVNTYTVTYHPNFDGTNPIEVVYNEGEDVTVADNTFSNPGFTFSEWNTQADGDGDPYVAGDVIENIHADIDFYAQWTENTTPGGGEDLELSFGMTSNPGGWPTANSNTLTEYTYTLGGVDYTFALKNVKCNSGYLMMTQVAVLGLPAIDGYKLTKVVASNSSGCSTSTKVGISSSATSEEYIDGGAIQTWSTTSSTYTYNLTSTAANTMYYMYVTNKNAQVTNLALTYESVGGTPAPSITADNVSIEYNATSGSIIYTINNGVEGGILSAATDSWLTLGEVGETVPFTCSVNEAAANRTATVTLTYTYGDSQTVNKNVTVTQAGDPNVTPTIAEVRAQGTGNVVTKGVVTSCVGVTGYIQDAEAAICVYGTSLTVGDEIRVSGTLTTYSGLLEITNPQVTVISSGNTVNPEPMTIEETVASTNQGWYIRIEDATVTAISGQNVTIAQDQNTIVVRFADANDIDFAVNDIISFNGNIGCYNNNNQIANPQNVEVQQPTEPIITLSSYEINVVAEGGNGSIEVTFENFTDIEPEIHFFEADGETQASYDWMTAELNAENDHVTYQVDANDGEARAAYFKVYEASEGVYSNLVTVNQAAYVVPTYAELPFAFDGGRADIEGTDGLSQENLGTDYNSSPKLKFEKGNKDNDGLYSTLVLQFSERPGKLTYDIKGNSFSGSTFKVQTSEDGVTYEDLETYTELGTIQHESFENLGENVRYIKWIYTEKNSGNVALGNIALAEYEEPTPEPSITVNPDAVSVDAEEHDGTLGLAYENLTITGMDDFGIQYYDAQGEETDEPGWVEVLIAEQDPTIAEGYVVSYYMIANDGEARTAYFKVFAMDDETNLVYSNLVTISQDEYVAPGTDGWVLTEFSELESGDVFVIVGNNGDTYAMENNGTSNAPAAVAVEVSDNTLTEEPAANLQWNIGITDNGYVFYPNGDTENWLYCTPTNNGVRVGTNENKAFVLDSETGYLMNVATSRYIGIYSSQDWRCYTNTTGNIANQTFAFYKKATGPKVATPTFDPAGGEFTAALNVIINCTTEDATIYYKTNENDDWTEYTDAISVDVTTTIWAYATKDEMDDSNIASATYTIVVPVASITVEPSEVNATYAETQGTLVVNYINIKEVVAQLIICDANGEQASYEWLVAALNDDNNVDYIIAANNGEARTAYLKVAAFDDNLEIVESDIVTINQAAYVVDYATLPFTFDGGKSDIATTTGLTQGGLGTDYNASPKLKFDTADDWMVLKINEEPGVFSFDIKGTGNPWSGVFDIQTSVDGTTYESLATYTTLLGDPETKTFDNLNSDVRYIRWYFTEKTSGCNVGVGNISLAAVDHTPSITLDTYEVNVDATENDGSIAVTYKNVDFTNSPDIVWFESDGETTTNEPDWMLAVINTTYDVDYTIEANDGEARTAYFKVYGLAETSGDDVYSDLVTVSQAAYVAPEAIITYHFNGITSSVETETGEIELDIPTIYVNGYIFVGWTTEEIEGVSESATYFMTYNVTEDIDLYAVLAIEKYEQATSVTEGIYALAAKPDENYRLFIGQIDSNTYGSGESVEEITPITVGDNVITIAATNNGYSMQFGDKYIGLTSDKNALNFNTEFSSEAYEWNISSDGEYMDIQNISFNTRTIRWNNSSNALRFACYKSGQDPVMLFRKAAYYCTTVSNPNIPTTTGGVMAEDYEIPAGSAYTIVDPITVPDGVTLTVNGTLGNAYENYLIIEDGGQVIVNNEGVAATVKKTLDNTSKDGVDGWYTIASPVNQVTPASVTNLIHSDPKDYDLYLYDEASAYWLNYKNPDNSDLFTKLVNGRGYLYWNHTGADLEFQGALKAANVEISLTCENTELPGFNLIGNPFSHNIYKGTNGAIDNSKLAAGYYTIENGSTWSTKLGYDDAIKPGQAILVQATENFDLTIANTADAATGSKANNDNIMFTVANSQYEDMTYALFSKGIGLNKIEHRDNKAPMVYIPQNDKNYAIATMSDDTEMFNLNFKAMTAGQYTLSFKAQGNYSYLHVIDRLTGEDIDMLLDGEYSFIGSPRDNEARFIVKLSYNASDVETYEFAYQNGSDIIVNGNGTLQVFDVMGRFVTSIEVNGNKTISAEQFSNGVYVFRMVGETIKTQKIVVR